MEFQLKIPGVTKKIPAGASSGTGLLVIVSKKSKVLEAAGAAGAEGAEGTAGVAKISARPSSDPFSTYKEDHP